MKNIKLLFWILVLFALVVPFSYAQSTVLFNESASGNDGSNWTTNGCDIDASGDGNFDIGSSDEYCILNRQIPNIDENTVNFTVELYGWTISTVSNGHWAWMLHDNMAGGTGRSNLIIGTSDSNTKTIERNGAGSGQSSATISMSTGTKYGVKFIFFTNRTIQVYIDDVFGGSVGMPTGVTSRYVRITSEGGSDTVQTLEGIAVYNTSQTFVPVGPDTVINNTKPVVDIVYPTSGDVINNESHSFFISGNVTLQNGTVTTVTINDTNFQNVGTNTVFNFTVNGTITSKQYVLNVTATSNHGNYSTDTVMFTFDDINPSISSSNLDTPLFKYKYGDNMTVSFTGSDNNLIYSMNVTTNGYTKNISGVNSLTYIFNTTINTSTFSTGINTLTAGICDAHTAKNIPEWSNFKVESRKQLEYVYSDGIVKIYPLTPGIIQNFDTYKADDRYHFVYQQKSSGVINFIVESNEFIDIIGNKKGYNAWLVIPSLNKWIDFNLPGLDASNYQVQRLSDTKVKVTIFNAPRVMNFESIGELNCNFFEYEYYLYDYTTYFSDSAIETSQQTYSLVFDYPEPYSAEVDLIHNTTSLYDTTSSGDNYSATFVLPDFEFSTQEVPLFFNFTFNGTYNETETYFQTLDGITLEACTYANQTNGTFGLNISLYDEQTPNSLILGDVQGTFNVWAFSKSNSANITVDLSGASQYSLCLYPNSTVNMEADLYYNTTGGFTQRWFLRDTEISNLTSLLNLYNFDTQTGISDVRGILRDTSYDYYPNIISKLLRFYPVENLYRTVQMDKSDDFGQILFHVIEESTDYIVTFESGGSEIDRTNPLKFICNNNVCDVTFIVELSQSNSDSDINFQYGYDNVSQMFQLNWSESTGLTSNVRLRVIKSTPSGGVDVCDTSVSSSTGTINCNTSGYDGLLTARVYTSQSPESWVLSIPIEKLVDKFFQLSGLDNNEVGMWALGISIIATMAGLLVSVVAGVALFLASLLSIYYLGLLSYLTLTYITIAFVLGVVVMVLVKR